MLSLSTKLFITCIYKSKEKKGYLVMKIDPEKTYIICIGIFFQKTLRFGFPDKIGSLIMFCISSSSLSLIWNGNVMENDVPKQRLEIRRPLITRPFCFMHGKICHTHNKTKVIDQARLIMRVLNDFEASSGLKVNVRKLKAFCSRRVARNQKDQVVSITSINFCPGLGKYLGFHLFHGRAKMEHFLFLVEKVNKRLSFWKDKMLNEAGRMTLVKSMLTWDLFKDDNRYPWTGSVLRSRSS